MTIAAPGKETGTLFLFSAGVRRSHSRGALSCLKYEKPEAGTLALARPLLPACAGFLYIPAVEASRGGKAFNVPGWREKSAAGFLYALFLVFLIFQLGGNSAADMPLRLILVQDGFYLLVQLGVHIF